MSSWSIIRLQPPAWPGLGTNFHGDDDARDTTRAWEPSGVPCGEQGIEGDLSEQGEARATRPCGLTARWVLRLTLLSGTRRAMLTPDSAYARYRSCVRPAWEIGAADQPASASPGGGGKGRAEKCNSTGISTVFFFFYKGQNKRRKKKKKLTTIQDVGIETYR